MGRSRDLADGTLAELNVDSNTLAVDATNNRVGIGTTSPSTKLDVTDSSRYTFNVGNAYTLQTSLNPAGSAFADDYKNASQHIWQTSGTERMRIDSSGRVTMPYQPAFSAYLTSIQNITTTSPVKINYDNTIFNTGNHFDTTNNRFVAPIAGKYFFSVNHNFYDVAVGNHVRTQIYTNAVLSQQGGYIYSDSTSDQNITTVVILNLSANDYVEVFTQSSDASYGLSNAQQWNKFFGYLLG